MFRLKRTTESASVQLNQLQPDKSSDQSRTMAWHWIGSIPFIYIFITCAGYASLLYISYANCHLDSGYNLWPIITYIDVTVPIFTYHSLHIILLPFFLLYPLLSASSTSPKSVILAPSNPSSSFSPSYAFARRFALA